LVSPYTWDADTRINTMLRRWHTDMGETHDDHIDRRIRSTGELDRHADAAGFDLVDTSAVGRVYLATADPVRR
jgi:hypothetical protein